ncbi:MAG: response regulator [Candidatus Omnitrophica bacterium]|nr:response regulator [Candidatus Omnitrophota bacterium]
MSRVPSLLIVHADRAVRERFCTILSHRGCPTLTASSAEEAMTVLKHEWPALILIGQQLTDTTGVEFVRRVRSFNEQVPILVLNNGQHLPSSVSASHEIQALLPEDITDEQLAQELTHWLQTPPTKPQVRWPGTVLVVDDEPKLREVLREFLHSQGFTVATADSGEAALECFAHSPPTVVLLDVNLPGMDGLSVLKQISARYPATTVIMITGLEEEETMGQAIALGAHDYILKPFNLEYLQTTLLSKLLLGQSP